MSSPPDVLHIGFSKCASTFLQHFFQEHGDIFLVNQSHFFAPFEYSHYPSGKDEYCHLFDKASANQLKLESDEHIVLPLFHPVLAAAATTLDSVAEVSSRIRYVQPDARIVIVIRNQVDLIVSRYSEYILGGGKGDFDFFVGEFLSCSIDRVNYYQNYYAAIVEIFRADFGADNVLILLQEDLAASEKSFLELLCGFLGIPVVHPSRRSAVAKRVGLSNLGLKVVHFFNRLIVIKQEMSSRRARVRIPYFFYKVIQRTIRTVDYYLPNQFKGSKNLILTDELVSRIRADFAADNRRLAEMLGRDLERVGY